MKQNEKWQQKYEEVVAFINCNRRNPSKHRLEEHDLLNWVKQQRKLMNAKKLKPERVGRFKELMELCEKYRRVNQYE